MIAVMMKIILLVKGLVINLWLGKEMNSSLKVV